MADADIAVRDRNAVGAVTGTVTATTTDAAVGDYVLILAAVDFRAPAELAINSPPAGVGDWGLIGTGSTNTNMDVKAWIAPVSTAGPKACTVSQSGGTSGLHVHWFLLDPAGGTITVDGAPTVHADNTTPYTHPTLTVAGTKDLLFCYTGVVQFAGVTLAFGSAPAGMTAQQNYVNQFSGLQVCWGQRSAAGSTGAQDQTSNVPTGSATAGGGSVAGQMFALRNDIAVIGPEPGRFLLAA